MSFSETSAPIRLRYSPVPVARVVGQAVVEAPLGQRFLLVEDELLQPHLHLSARHSACRSKPTVQEDHKQPSSGTLMAFPQPLAALYR